MKNSKSCPLGLFGNTGSKLFPSVNQIRRFSKLSKLFLRKPRKIQPEELVSALLASVCFAQNSCRAIALELGICSDVDVSRKAIWDRLKLPAIVPFLQFIIEHAMGQSMVDEELIEQRQIWLKSEGKKSLSRIKRVLVGDASTFALHPSLAAVFPGSKNQTSIIKSHLKLQLVTDLLTGKWIHFSFDLYQRSDLKAALDIIPFLKPGDLLLRDLGYFSPANLRAIIEAQAFFISRLKASRVKVFDLDGEEIPLLKVLQKRLRKAGDTLRLPILLTASDKMPCYLIAVRVPDEVANLRRRRIKEQYRQKGKKAPGKFYLQLQSWTILITNLEESDASDEQIFRWYQMRWRVEMIFKACKSHSGWLRLASHRTNQNHIKAMLLAWILSMVILADRGVFRMARIRRGNLIGEGGPPDNGRLENMETVNLSILKSLGKLVMSLGFQIELTGCRLDFFEHNRRMLLHMERHNKTELIPSRLAMVEILEVALKNESLT